MDIASIKQEFLDENDKHLENIQEISKKYNLQKERVFCKNCGASLKKQQKDFINHGTIYKICEKCSHLNGDKEDTTEYTEWLYKNEGGSNYSNNYLKSYEKRVSNIYLPKVRYLKNSLEELCGLQNFSIFDIGCGGGHFVYSSNILGIPAKGIDISAQLIKLASEFWESSDAFNTKPPFACIDSEEELIKEIRESKSEVISLIGVLEHLMNPNDALKAFAISDSKYMFFAVPLFSLATFIENVSKNTFPRHLSGGHTHLYTHESINYFCEKFNFQKISKWHFGMDAMDLRRALIVETTKNGTSKRARKLIEDKLFSPIMMNEIQEVLDRHLGGSDVHMLIGKK